MSLRPLPLRRRGGLRVPHTTYRLPLAPWAQGTTYLLPPSPLGSAPHTRSVGVPLQGGDYRGGGCVNNKYKPSRFIPSLSTVGSAPPHIVWGGYTFKVPNHPCIGGMGFRVVWCIYLLHPSRGSAPPTLLVWGYTISSPLLFLPSSPGDIHIQDPSLFPPSGF